MIWPVEFEVIYGNLACRFPEMADKSMKVVVVVVVVMVHGICSITPPARLSSSPLPTFTSPSTFLPHPEPLSLRISLSHQSRVPRFTAEQLSTAVKWCEGCDGRLRDRETWSEETSRVCWEGPFTMA
ncbi:hypothetical protein E2C01_046562 [Portunus trituberculatus]|uniref:Uncharacterized protein n=1 Tax=Portunus trituberculatus TaxID=210409 RepID=A0A5B7G5E3_PORTR|nr:hypothetical protein [Portunus trituberculatus]